MSTSNWISGRPISLALLLLLSLAMAGGSENPDAGQSNDTMLTTLPAGEYGEDGPSVNSTTAQVHVYVNNKDDDRLDVSLFIDGDLIDSNELSSDSEKKYGSYDLAEGNHSFEISWRDEDTKKTYREKIDQSVQDGDTVMIYTVKNTEPDEYDLTVQARNENDFDLDAYLYIDGDYEKNREIKKESSADIGKISLEEGVHEITLRWQDPDTEMQYEKKKQVMVERDDVIVFYAPRGVSFESTEAKSTSKTSSSTTSSSMASSSTAKSSSSKLKSESAAENDSGQEGKVNSSSRQLGNSSSESSSKSSSKLGSTSIMSSSNDKLSTKNALTSKALASQTERGTEVSSFGNDDDGWRVYIYALLVLLGLYLFFRH